jgi:hypothetical protein
VVWNQHHRRRVRVECGRHDNGVRSIAALIGNRPIGAGRLTLVEAQPTAKPTVQRVDILGGLIHECRHAA